MWFNQNIKQTVQDVSSTLAGIASDGISVSIHELIQYQRKSSLINLAARKNQQGRMSGNYLARSKGRGMEFDEVRHYQNGDDIRAIDWRVTARTGKTHTKLFREEIERPVLVATDLSSSMLFGSKLLFKSVQACHLAALVTWHAKNRGDRVGGIVFNQQQHSELKPRSRKQGVLHYLHTLVETHKKTLASQDSSISSDADNTLKQGAGSLISDNQSSDNQGLSNNTLGNNNQENAISAFDNNCARLRQLAKPGCLVYLISDGHNVGPEAIRHLSHISRHCELVVCLISDPLEHDLPTSKQKMTVAVTDGISRQQLTIGDNQSAKQYHQQAQEINNQKEDLLVKAGARVIHFSAGESLEQQLTSGDNSWIR
jgi:uncharacterized protein (DUF58 family)